MTDIAQAVSIGTWLAVTAVLIHVAWHDFWHMIIRNKVVLALIGLYVIWRIFVGFEGVGTDLIAGVVLGTLGMVFWLLRMMGAGDVKLYFVLGLFTGLGYLGLFAILLLVISFLFVGVVSLLGRGEGGGPVRQRFSDIRTAGRAPYGVVLCLTALPCITLRLIA